MATFVAAVADVFAWEATSGTTTSFSQGSANRYLFGGAGWITFGSTPTISDLKYGGSGGTTITANGSDTAVLFGNGNTRAGEVIPGPSGTTTIYTAASSSVLQGSAAGASYEGVDSSSDFTSNSGASGDVTTTVASVTVPNCVTGQTVTAIVWAASLNLIIDSFTAVSGTTIRAQDKGDVGTAFLAIAVLEKVATADGNCTLSVNCNSTGTDTIGWVVKGERLIDAAGGAEGPVGRADETDTALAMSALQITATGVASETDSAQALSALQIAVAGVATDASSAFALSAVQLGSVGVAVETETAFALSPAGEVGVAVETDSAFALAALQIGSTGLASETDTALDLAGTSGNAVGMSTDTSTAFALGGVQIGAVGLAQEVDAAFALIPLQAAEVGVATEQDFALWLDAVQIAAVGMAIESDIAFALADGSEPAVIVRSAPPASRREQGAGRTNRVQAASRTPRTQTRAR